MNSMKGAVFNVVQEMAWAIKPEVLEMIAEILYARLEDSSMMHIKEGAIKLEKKPFEVQLFQCEMSRWGGNGCGTVGADSENAITKNIAVIPMEGTMSKRMNMFMELSGGTSTEQVASAIKDAVSNDDVHAIVLDIDSPGGSVDGTKELADLVATLRHVKPIVAYANGTMASAAYWVGSGASEIVAYDTTGVGSIGVLTVHYDRSKRDESAGIKRTVLHAGKYKAHGNDTAPLDDVARGIIQERLDKYYTMFVNSIAANRGVEQDIVAQKWADGRMFVAHDALALGMIDRIGTFDDAVSRAAELSQANDIEREYDMAEPIGDEEV